MLSDDCFKTLTVGINDLYDVNLLKKLEKLADIVKFDLSSAAELPVNFLNKFVDFLANIDIYGVIMHLSEEINHVASKFQQEIKSVKERVKNKFVAFNTDGNLKVIFLDGIKDAPVKILSDIIRENRKKNIYFDFNYMSPEVLAEFLPAFIGWSVSNLSGKRIHFSEHGGEIKEILAGSDIYCITKVSSLIASNFYACDICNPENKVKKFINIASMQI